MGDAEINILLRLFRFLCVRDARRVSKYITDDVLYREQEHFEFFMIVVREKYKPYVEALVIVHELGDFSLAHSQDLLTV